MKLNYLCITGSLGWGYYDADSSDIDMRGVYSLNERDRCLRNGMNSEHMSAKLLPVECEFWSLDKFVRLLRTSNPTCVEWLLSPVMFSDDMFREFRKLAAHGRYDRHELAMHYISMAKSNYMKYRHDLTPKKLRYVMRGIESANRLCNNCGSPLMDISELEMKEPIDIPSLISYTKRAVQESTAPSNGKWFDYYIEVMERYI